jgi:hypothetical protein
MPKEATQTKKTTKKTASPAKTNSSSSIEEEGNVTLKFGVQVLVDGEEKINISNIEGVPISHMLAISGIQEAASNFDQLFDILLNSPLKRQFKLLIQEKMEAHYPKDDQEPSRVVVPKPSVPKPQVSLPSPEVSADKVSKIE